MLAISSSEFTLWQAYYLREPWDGKRGDYQAALVSSIVANVNRGKGQRPYPVEDFLLKFEPPRAMSSADREVERMLRQVEGINRFFGGKDERLR